MEHELAANAAGTAQLLQPLARGWWRSHPSTLHMVIEALQAQNDTKGTSVVAIKRFILSKYPTVDPIRLKYLLKQALSKGLSRGDLVRPRNSSAVGATGRFKLAPEKLRHKQPPGQVDSNEGQAPKPGRKGTTKAPVAGARQRGTVKEKPAAEKAKPTAVKEKPAAEKAKPTAVKEKPAAEKAKPTAVKEKPAAEKAKPTAVKEKPAAEKAKPTAAKEKPAAEKAKPTAVKAKSTAQKAKPTVVKGKPTAEKAKPRVKPTDAQPPAAAKPRSDGAKPLQAASHRRAPGKGHSQLPMGLAAEDAGGGGGDGAGAGAKGPRKAPVGKSKGKASRGEQQDATKAKGGRGKVRKTQAAPSVGQGEAGLQQAAPPAVGRKAP